MGDLTFKLQRNTGYGLQQKHMHNMFIHNRGRASHVVPCIMIAHYLQSPHTMQRIAENLLWKVFMEVACLIWHCKILLHLGQREPPAIQY